VLVLALTPTLVVPAGAQFTSALGGNFNNPGSALIGTMIANRMLADAARKAAPPDQPASTTRPASVASPARLTFKPAARNLMVDELAAALVKDAASRQQLSKAFEGYLREFDDQARRDREPSYDVGRAAAFFVMVNYFAATGREPTDAQADGAQAIFRAGLAESRPFAQMNDEARQRLYESLVILGTFPLAAATHSAHDNNSEQEKMFRVFAAELVQTLIGVPVEKVRLTPTGFRIVE
jgi:hypothetical protein